MKKLNIILSAILLVMFVGCKDSKHLNDDLIHIDLSKSYPKKELILQDFMDVEYIPLETTDDFLTQGIVKAIYQVTVYNNDYIEKRPVAMTAKSINREVESVTTLNASPLIETYKKGKLKEGPLKEIVSKLNDEDNPIIMVVKQKQ